MRHWPIPGHESIRVCQMAYTTPLERHRRHTAARAAVCRLLAYMLGTEGEVSYAHTPSGAPYLEGEGMPQLSISHTEGYVAVALSAHQPIGIDIERLSGQVERVSSRFVSLRERALLPESPQEYLVALHLLWSAKEAAYKLLDPPSRSLLSFELSEPLPSLGLEQTGTLTLLYHPAQDERASEAPAPTASITIHYTLEEEYVMALALAQ